jgi:hypothetical protein
MLTESTAAPDTLQFPAIVEVMPGQNPNHGLRCRLYHRDSWCDAWTWLPLASTPPSALRIGHVTTLDIGQDPNDLLLLGLREDATTPLSSVLPETLCPLPGVLRQATRLIDGLASPPLHEFVSRALLLNPVVLHGYWNSPASRRDHHAYPGGLAEHSLEVATMLASASGLPNEDRELGIVFALLHDYGKIWCYDPLAFDPVDPRAHEAHGLAQLAPALRRLQEQDALLGARLQELLGGPRAPRENKYPLAIGRIVRSFDQMSCEKTRRVLAESGATSNWPVPF